MYFLWTEVLWLAVFLPILVALYLWLLRRRKRGAIRYSGLAMVKAAMSRGAAWRRHLPPTLLLVALSALIVGGARPMVNLTLPTSQRTLILAMDVSLSMSADDVAPNRISASQAAARAFAEQLPRNVRIGVVAYGGSAHVVQNPTLSREDVLGAIDRFQLQRGTAIGRGILASLKALFPEQSFDLGRNPRLPSAVAPRNDGAASAALTPSPPPIAPGSYESAAIVLLTDGENTSGPDPIEAAQLAADRGVRVFTVGFGTPGGTHVAVEGMKLRVRLDEATMKRVANLTGAEYFHAGSGGDLMKVYDSLKARLALESKPVEASALLALSGALLILLSAGFSLLWFGRVA